MRRVARTGESARRREGREGWRGKDEPQLRSGAPEHLKKSYRSETVGPSFPYALF